MTASNLFLPTTGVVVPPMGRSNVNNRQFRRSNPNNARRTLFGKPEPGEIKEICQQSFEQDRQRMLKNYGFDTRTGKPVNENENVDTQDHVENNTDADNVENILTNDDVEHNLTKDEVVVDEQIEEQPNSRDNLVQSNNDEYNSSLSEISSNQCDEARGINIISSEKSTIVCNNNNNDGDLKLCNQNIKLNGFNDNSTILKPKAALPSSHNSAAIKKIVTERSKPYTIQRKMTDTYSQIKSITTTTRL